MVTEIPVAKGIFKRSGLSAICRGADGNMWFTDFPADRVGRVGRVRSDGSITWFSGALAETGDAPEGCSMTLGADGNVWFTRPSAGKIGRVTREGVITEVAGLAAKSRPLGIAGGKDGNVWFTDFENCRVSRIDASGTITEFPAGLDAGEAPYDIAVAADGQLWFTVRPALASFEKVVHGLFDMVTTGATSGAFLPEGGRIGRIGRMSPDGTVPPPTKDLDLATSPTNITAAPDGSCWFTTDRAVIGRVTADGKVQQFRNFEPDGVLGSIVVDAKANAWVFDTRAGEPPRLATISPNGGVTTVETGLTRTCKAYEGPWSIAFGGDGTVWFTDPGARRICFFQPGAS